MSTIEDSLSIVHSPLIIFQFQFDSHSQIYELNLTLPKQQLDYQLMNLLYLLVMVVDEVVKMVRLDWHLIDQVLKVIEEAELKKAKAYLKGKTVLNLEDCEEFAHLLAKYELLRGGAKDPEEIFKLLDAVTVEDIERVAKDLFVEGEMRLAVIGPYGEKGRFEPLLKF